MDMMMPCDLRKLSVLSCTTVAPLLLFAPAPELATGAMFEAVADGLPEVPVPADALGLLPLSDAEALGLVASAAVMKGFEDVPPVPVVRSRVKLPWLLCWRMVAD